MRNIFLVIAVIIGHPIIINADSPDQAVTIDSMPVMVTAPAVAPAEAEQFLPLYNLLAIHDLNGRSIKFGTYHVIGYVIKKYTCPPCPEKAMCKPCQRDHVIVSEDNKEYHDEDLTDRELTIFADNVQAFEIGKKYRFLIHVLDLKTTRQEINDVKLIYFEPVREEP